MIDIFAKTPIHFLNKTLHSNIFLRKLDLLDLESAKEAH